MASEKSTNHKTNGRSAKSRSKSSNSSLERHKKKSSGSVPKTTRRAAKPRKTGKEREISGEDRLASQSLIKIWRCIKSALGKGYTITSAIEVGGKKQRLHGYSRLKTAVSKPGAAVFHFLASETVQSSTSGNVALVGFDVTNCDVERLAFEYPNCMAFVIEGNRKVALYLLQVNNSSVVDLLSQNKRVFTSISIPATANFVPNSQQHIVNLDNFLTETKPDLFETPIFPSTHFNSLPQLPNGVVPESLENAVNTSASIAKCSKTQSFHAILAMTSTVLGRAIQIRNPQGVALNGSIFLSFLGDDSKAISQTLNVLLSVLLDIQDRYAQSAESSIKAEQVLGKILSAKERFILESSDIEKFIKSDLELNDRITKGYQLANQAAGQLFLPVTLNHPPILMANDYTDKKLIECIIKGQHSPLLFHSLDELIFLTKANQSLCNLLSKTSQPGFCLSKLEGDRTQFVSRPSLPMLVHGMCSDYARLLKQADELPRFVWAKELIIVPHVKSPTYSASVDITTGASEDLAVMLKEILAFKKYRCYQPEIIGLSESAEEVLNEWAAEYHADDVGQNKVPISTNTVLKYALLIQVLISASEGELEVFDEVDDEAVESAIDLLTFTSEITLRVISPDAYTIATDANKLVDFIRRDKSDFFKHPFTASSLAQRRLAGFQDRDSGRMYELLGYLHLYGLVKVEEQLCASGSGQPTTKWRVNPVLSNPNET